MIQRRKASREELLAQLAEARLIGSAWAKTAKDLYMAHGGRLVWKLAARFEKNLKQLRRKRQK